MPSSKKPPGKGQKIWIGRIFNMAVSLDEYKEKHARISGILSTSIAHSFHDISWSLFGKLSEGVGVICLEKTNDLQFVE